MKELLKGLELEPRFNLICLFHGFLASDLTVESAKILRKVHNDAYGCPLANIRIETMPVKDWIEK